MKLRRLKGFEDWFAEDMLIRNHVIETFKTIFEKYGYEPLETPALEYAELMLGQSGEEAEKQFYRFKDPGGRDVMMKYEVLVSMARAVAQRVNEIPQPYKRYQIQRVWRAENTQKGRYREFTQCDADTIGSTSLVNDAEFIQMGLEAVANLGFSDFECRISNRKFLEGLSEYVGVNKDDFYGFCMSIDKLPKIGAEKVINELIDKRGVDKEKAKLSLNIIDNTKNRDYSYLELIESMKDSVGSNDVGSEGLEELIEIGNFLVSAGVDSNKYRFDPSIARGLAYYTGPVWEFEVKDGNVGSIAGCGRYDKLINKYVGFDVPATGGSFGIERITEILKDRNMTSFGKTPVELMVSLFDEKYSDEAISIANVLRQNGIKTMLYPQFDKLGKQFKYADKKGIKWVLIIGEDEVNNGTVSIKNMFTGDQEVISVEKAVNLIKTSR